MRVGSRRLAVAVISVSRWVTAQTATNAPARIREMRASTRPSEYPAADSGTVAERKYGASGAAVATRGGRQHRLQRADIPQSVPELGIIERPHGDLEKSVDPLPQDGVGVVKRSRNLGIRALCLRRV